MNILFVNADKIGSKIIQYGTEDSMSHVGIQFDDCPFVYHAYGTKIHETPVSEFMGKYNLVNFVKISLLPQQEKKVLALFKKSIWYEGYDYKAFFYFAWDRFKAKFFGGKQAKVNPLDSSIDMICTEVVYLVDEFYQDVTGKYLLPGDIDLSITKPGQLFSILKSRFP